MIRVPNKTARSGLYVTAALALALASPAMSQDVAEQEFDAAALQSLSSDVLTSLTGKGPRERELDALAGLVTQAFSEAEADAYLEALIVEATASPAALPAEADPAVDNSVTEAITGIVNQSLAPQQTEPTLNLPTVEAPEASLPVIEAEPDTEAATDALVEDPAEAPEVETALSEPTAEVEPALPEIATEIDELVTDAATPEAATDVAPELDADAAPEVEAAPEEAEVAVSTDAEPVEEAPEAPVRVHVVSAGESLASIAQQYYGSPQAYTRVFEANRELLGSPDAIAIGQQLVIPE